MNVVPARSVTSLVVILNYSKLSYSEHVFFSHVIDANTPNCL